MDELGEGRVWDTADVTSSSPPSQSFLSAIAHLSDDPKSLEEVMSRPDWPKWKEAMDAEIQQLLDLGTYSLKDIPFN